VTKNYFIAKAKGSLSIWKLVLHQQAVSFSADITTKY